MDTMKYSSSCLFLFPTSRLWLSVSCFLWTGRYLPRAHCETRCPDFVFSIFNIHIFKTKKKNGVQDNLLTVDPPRLASSFPELSIAVLLTPLWAATSGGLCCECQNPYIYRRPTEEPKWRRCLRAVGQPQTDDRAGGTLQLISAVNLSTPPPPCHFPHPPSGPPSAPAGRLAGQEKIKSWLLRHASQLDTVQMLTLRCIKDSKTKKKKLSVCLYRCVVRTEMGK